MPEYEVRSLSPLEIVVTGVVDGAKKFQGLLREIPVLNDISDWPVQWVVALLVIAALLLIALLVSFLFRAFQKIRYRMLCSKVKRLFGIPDLKNFKVHRMGKPETKYYIPDAGNIYRLYLPHWKHANKDGSKKRKWFNRIVWEESCIWLRAKKVTYVLCTKDPWEMIYLVHQLREYGVSVIPCQMEQEKKDQLNEEALSTEAYIQQLIASMDGEESSFVELCRNQFETNGYKVIDAPQNRASIELFVQKGREPRYVKCLFVTRKHLTGLDDMKLLREVVVDDLFGDGCLLITTGRITIAAANYARGNNIEIILDDSLVDFTATREKTDPAKAFRKWELTEKDISAHLPDDLIRKISR